MRLIGEKSGISSIHGLAKLVKKLFWPQNFAKKKKPIQLVTSAKETTGCYSTK
jgi:hypothetical protein